MAERIGSKQQTVSRWIGHCKECYKANSQNIGKTGPQIAAYINRKIEAGLSLKEIMEDIKKEKTK